MAGEEILHNPIVEKREEFMVEFTDDQTPALRTAHFIKPTLSPFSKLPPLPKIQSLPLSKKPKIIFLGSPPPEKKWVAWFEKLKQTHEPAWRKAGIFDAIKGSTYKIVIHKDLLFSLAEKWCPETNTFVFPWGEATVTLEDVMVLGGFSPLGESVLSNCSLGQNVEHLVDRLMNCKRDLQSKSMPYVTHIRWAEYFIGIGNELEHAAFLALWLSRYVFSTKARCVIRASLFNLAAELSSGSRIALAPAILAIIYRGLRLLKEKLADCSDGLCGADRFLLIEPFHLVQLWAWERFPKIAPIPRMINHGEPRLARWKGRKRYYISSKGLNMALDSAQETFRWRPYATFVENWPFPSFYDDAGKWVSIESDEEWELFACCLRVCQLESHTDSENYHPHRVAMQFGFDQDIPCSVPRLIDTLEANCRNLIGLTTSTKLYLPPRLFQGGVTVKYSDWWKGKNVLLMADNLLVYSRRKRTSSNIERPICVLDANLHENVAVTVHPSSSPAECNMIENVEENPKETSQHCGPRNGNGCRELSSEMINQVAIECKPCMILLKDTTDKISVGNSRDLVIINEDAEESQGVPLFETLASNMEDLDENMERPPKETIVDREMEMVVSSCHQK